jgi:hypothetical protein
MLAGIGGAILNGLLLLPTWGGMGMHEPYKRPTVQTHQIECETPTQDEVR